MTAKRKTDQGPAKAGPDWDRRFKRVRDWALEQPKEVLALHLAGVTCSWMMERKLARLRLEVAGQRVIDEVAKNIATSVTHSWDRKKGAMVKLARDPTQQAKQKANELWPIAHRRGWTALQMHGALVDAGHEVAPGTVARWMTKLRRTGVC